MNTTTKHTPGPWNVSADGYDPAACAFRFLVDVAPLTKGDAVSDSRLIAAAPELLAALRGWVAIFGGCIFNSPHIDGLLTQARAAIAKADGTQ
jgi:hypothetical protein